MPTVNMKVLEESRRHQVVQKYEVYPLNTSDVEDYQIKTTGVASSIEEDVRIIQDGSQLDQWAESKGNVWSKLINLKAKTPQIVLGLSGNPSSVDTDDIDATMIFGDDFSGTNLDSTPISGDITVSGDAGKYEAWPGIAKDVSGNLFVVYRTSNNNIHSFDATGKVVIRKSTDNGQTWGAEITVSDVANNDDRNANILIFDNSGTETILVVYNSHDGNGANDRIFVRKSTDGGVNWGSAIAITPASERRSYGEPILLSNNKILIPIDNSMAPWKVFVVESSNGGDSWTEYEIGTDAVHHINEISIIETKTAGSYTGGIYAIIRTDLAPYTYYKATSTDYGHTWSAVTAVGDISNTYKTPFSLHRAPNGSIYGICTTSGNDIVIHNSVDECVNWTEIFNIVNDATTSGYPHMEIISYSELIVVWCTNAATSDVFVNFIDYPLIVPKWINIAGSPTVTNNILEMINTCKINSTDTFNQNIIYESKLYIKDVRSIGLCETPFDFDGDSATHSTEPAGRGFICEHNNDNWWQGVAITEDAWKKHKIIWTSTDVNSYEEGVAKGHKITTDGNGIPTDAMSIYFYTYTDDTELLRCEWVFIRKYTTNEPIIQNINTLNRSSLIKALGSRL